MKNELMDTVFLIIMYDKELNNSQTFKKLLSIKNDFEKSKLIVWNNGPKYFSKKKIDQSNMNISLEIIENINNISLSKIYNYFIENYKAKRYVILDDDTSITSDYIKDVDKVDSDSIGVPIVTANNEIESPIINGKPYKKNKRINNKDKVVAIGSGLVIGNGIVKIVSDRIEKLFDERFILYGVDTSFFFRLRQLGLIDKIKFLKGFNHSLSRLESEFPEKTKFRLSERGAADGLIFRYYYPKRVAVQIFIKYTFIFIFEYLRKDKMANYRKYFLLALIKGKHHRN